MFPVQCELRCVTEARSSQTLFASPSIFMIVALPPSTVRNTKNKMGGGGGCNKLQSSMGSCLSAIPTSMSKHIVHANTVCWKECSSKIAFLYSEICVAFRWLSSDGITFQFLDSVIFFYFLFFFPAHHEEHNTTPTNAFCFMIHLSSESCMDVKSTNTQSSAAGILFLAK